jgi:hypothetical protein
MNRYKLFFSLLMVSLVMVGCKYDDFMVDYTYSAVYFPKLMNTRTFVVGEIHDIKVGVILGGKRANKVEEWVSYQIDPTLVPAGSVLLPPDYYTLSNNEKMVIPVGSFQGAVTISIDTAKFLNDPLSLQAKYVLPFRLISTSADSILPLQRTQVISLKYEQKYFGNYYHNGVTTITNAQGIITNVGYHQEEPVTNVVNNWIVTTVGPYTLQTNGISNNKGGVNNSFYMTVTNNGEVTISKSPISAYNVVGGPSSYNPQKREFYLRYSYANAGSTYQVNDTLIFRNRILDGVNQWR